MEPRICKPIFVEKPWGGRSLKRLFNKDLPPGRAIGESWELYNKKFPVVVKLIDVKEPLSIQVHPHGKSELWYVIEAGARSKMLGGVTLDRYKIDKGTWIYIPDGTVHTIFPPAVLLEISQNKLITYRLYDWGRRRGSLDIEKGLSVLRPEAKPQVYRDISSFQCPHFRVELIELEDGRIQNQKLYVYFILKGRGRVREVSFKRGDTILVPTNCDIEVLSTIKLFRIPL